LPTGFDWRTTSPFAEPDIVVNSYFGESFYAQFVGTGRGFLKKATSTALIGNYTWSRVQVNNLADFGIRVDDGTDINYVEFRVVHTSGPTYVLRLRQRTLGGSITTTNVTQYSTAYPLTIMLHPAGTVGSWAPYCYIANETASDVGAGVSQVLLGSTVSWTPAAFGLCFDNNGQNVLDWIRTI
jgi:hypothetical protein